MRWCLNLIKIGGGLLLGLLIGTVFYIIGGYSLPFFAYAIFMLALVPFSARLIPSKPKEETNVGDKLSDEDQEIALKFEQERSNSLNVTGLVNKVVVKKRHINPIKIIYRLLKNKVS